MYKFKMDQINEMGSNIFNLNKSIKFYEHKTMIDFVGQAATD